MGMTSDKRLKTILILLIIVISFGVLYHFAEMKSGVPDVINKIIIRGHKTLNKEEILATMEIGPGESFAKYDLALLEKKLKGHSRVRDASVLREENDRLVVTVIERNPVAVLNSGKALYEVDEELYVLSKGDVRTPDLVVISGNFTIEAGRIKGTRIRDLMKFIMVMFDGYPALEQRISEIFLSSDGEIYFYIFRPKKLKVLVGTVLNITQVRRLYASLAYFEEEGKDITLLDLRGEDAVYH